MMQFAFSAFEFFSLLAVGLGLIGSMAVTCLSVARVRWMLENRLELLEYRVEVLEGRKPRIAPETRSV